MKTYTLTRSTQMEVPCPEVLPLPGDKLVVTKEFYTPRTTYIAGDILTLIERTNDSPHGVLSSLGNWIVEDDRVGTTVWTNIEMALADGTLSILPQ